MLPKRQWSTLNTLGNPSERFPAIDWHLSTRLRRFGRAFLGNQLGPMCSIGPAARKLLQDKSCLSIQVKVL